jgi:hypothetical protein
MPSLLDLLLPNRNFDVRTNARPAAIEAAMPEERASLAFHHVRKSYTDETPQPEFTSTTLADFERCGIPKSVFL